MQIVNYFLNKHISEEGKRMRGKQNDNMLHWSIALALIEADKFGATPHLIQLDF